MSKHQPTILEIGQMELDGLRERIAALETALAEAQAALVPFAKFADVSVLPESNTYPMFDFPEARITVGDFRKAKAALAAGKEKGVRDETH